MRPLPLAVLLTSTLFLGHTGYVHAQGMPSASSICNIPSQRGTAMYNKYCTVPNSSVTTNNNAAANAAAAAAAAALAEAAAEVERKRQAELAQPRTDADAQHRAEEIANQARFLDDRNSAAGTLRGSDGAAPVVAGDTGLRGVANPELRDSSPPLELRSSAPPPNQPVTDPMVVDARHVPTGLPASLETEIPNTPAGDRVRKGFQAIQDHDWNVARAWFQDALLRDPGNTGIARLVDLASFTLKRESPPHLGAASAAPQIGAAATTPGVDTIDTHLASFLTDFDRNYLPRHPELKQPWKSSAPASSNPDKAHWNDFFDNIFSPSKMSRYAVAVAATRG